MGGLNFLLVYEGGKVAFSFMNGMEISMEFKFWHSHVFPAPARIFLKSFYSIDNFCSYEQNI